MTSLWPCPLFKYLIFILLYHDPILVWSAVIEEDFGQERFLPDHPINLINSGELADVPFITGVTQDEFASAAMYLVDDQTLLSQLDKDWDTIAPICFVYERNTEKSLNVSESARKFYIPEGPLNNNSMVGLGQLFADSVIGYSENRIAKLYSEKKSEATYYYRFSYPGRFSYQYWINTTTPFGVSHHDDLIYQYYISELFPFFNSSYPEIEMVETLTSIYANFAKTGNPNNKTDEEIWPRFTLEKQQYLDIGKTLEIKEKLYEDRYKFWENFYPTDDLTL